MGEEDYILLALQERARQRNIAKAYFGSAPSIQNLYNGVKAFWNSLPIVGVTPLDMNPHMNTGVAPVPGRIRPIPSKAIDILKKQTFPRRNINPAVAEQKLPKTYREIELPNISDHAARGGRFNTVTGEIELNPKYAERAAPHELRHAHDKDFPLTKEEHQMLKDAYDDNFVGYNNEQNVLGMMKERVTTNADIRNVILEDLGLLNAPVEVLNQAIANTNMHDLYYAMRRANNYAKQYATKLATGDEYLNNGALKYVQTLRNIKKAMMYVGGLSIPLLLTDPQKFYKETFK